MKYTSARLMLLELCCTLFCRCSFINLGSAETWHGVIRNAPASVTLQIKENKGTSARLASLVPNEELIPVGQSSAEHQDPTLGFLTFLILVLWCFLLLRLLPNNLTSAPLEVPRAPRLPWAWSDTWDRRRSAARARRDPLPPRRRREGRLLSL